MTSVIPTGLGLVVGSVVGMVTILGSVGLAFAILTYWIMPFVKRGLDLVGRELGELARLRRESAFIRRRKAARQRRNP